MKEDWISSSTTTCSIRSAVAATYCLTASRIDEGVLGILLDELASSLDVLPHEDAEHQVGCSGVVQGDLLEHAGLGVHRRLPELLGLHLGQALEPLDVHLLLAVPDPDVLQPLLVVYVEVLPVHLHSVQRRLGHVDLASVDQVLHVAEEKRKEQRADVRAVDVRVGKDGDLAVAGLRQVELVADARSDRADQRLDLQVLKDLVQPSLLDVGSSRGSGGWPD